MNEKDCEEFIDIELEKGPPFKQWFPRCWNCGVEWHGLPNSDGCPGAFLPTGVNGEKHYDEAGRYWGDG